MGDVTEDGVTQAKGGNTSGNFTWMEEDGEGEREREVGSGIYN